MRAIFILYLLIPVATFSQSENIKLENHQVIFEKKYVLDSLSADKVKSLLSSKIPIVKGITDYYNGGEVITAKLKNATIDYRVYGGKWATTATYLNYPFDANVSIIWKEGAYKVTVTNIVFRVPALGDIELGEAITSKKGTIFSSNKTSVKATGYIDNYLSDLFTFKKDSSNW